ncbi:hypothetical protein LSAT2_000774, partial [Lamellibrachia satsuma]
AVATGERLPLHYSWSSIQDQMMKVTRRGRPDSAQSTTMAHSMYPTCHCYPHTPHWAGMAVDDVVQVVPLLGHFLERTTVGKHDSPCAAHRIRRQVRPHTRRSFPDASQHGRVLSARRLGFCSFPECRGCADKRAPQRRVEVRGRGDHDAPFVGPHGCPTTLMLLHPSVTRRFICAQQHVDRQSAVSPEHQVMRRVASAAMRSDVVGMYDLLQMVCPLSLLLG